MVLLTAPLGVIGVAAALLLFDRPFGFVAMLGMIALGGMIMRNTVILVDQIRQDVGAGLTRWDAVRESAVRRFRPITLTAAASVLAMIPLSRDVLWGPMAFVDHGRADRRHRADAAVRAGVVRGLVPDRAFGAGLTACSSLVFARPGVRPERRSRERRGPLRGLPSLPSKVAAPRGNLLVRSARPTRVRRPGLTPGLEVVACAVSAAPAAGCCLVFSRQAASSRLRARAAWRPWRAARVGRAARTRGQTRGAAGLEGRKGSPRSGPRRSRAARQGRHAARARGRARPGIV